MTKQQQIDHYKEINLSKNDLSFMNNITGESGVLRIRSLNSRPSITRKSSPGRRIPHLPAMERAVLMLSPVTIRTQMPAL